MTGERIELIGVYDADGTVRGELAYLVGRAVGKAHCALCDITHATLRERPVWRSCRAGLGAPFDTHHRDDQPPAVEAATNGSLPAVLARTTTGRLLVLLGPDDLERCDGSPEQLVVAIHDAVQRHAMTVGDSLQ